MNKSLPIWQVADQIRRALSADSRLVLIAPTGSGKTTQVPQLLLEAGIIGEKKIVVLQPRRVAARTVASRVASEMETALGDRVGYQIRFEDRTSLGTRICFVTEGILLRWLQDDPQLSEVGAVLFDEFHERNLFSDVALGIVKDLQSSRRGDLRLIVMSATLDAEPVAEYLNRSRGSEVGPCPVIVSEGRTFPVEVQYLTQHDERPITQVAAEMIDSILSEDSAGDILVFMPGIAEINSTIAAVESRGSNVLLIPLHGELSPEAQDIAFKPSPQRKVVVATNVAETSVTIDGIRYVVDSGLARVSRFDSNRGIHTLFIENISRASAEQRKGRAGRTGPGICYRLWTESSQLDRPERNTPEIQRSDLAETVLLIHSLGIHQADSFDWLDAPELLAVRRAEALLETLGALSRSPSDATSLIMTKTGHMMLRLPMHPRFSRMLVEAAHLNCVKAAALCAALVSGRDLLVRLKREDKHIEEARELFEASQDSDFYTLMRAFQFAKNNHFSPERCRRYGIHAQIARQVDQTFEHLMTIVSNNALLRKAAQEGPNLSEPEPTGEPLLRCLMVGFIDQLCVRRNLGTLDCEMTDARSANLMRESVVQNAKLFVAATVREVEGRGSNALTLVGLATAVQFDWIQKTFPGHLRSTIEHLYDRTHRRVSAIQIIRFRDLIIHHEHQKEIDPSAAGLCLADAWQRGWLELSGFDHSVKQFISRVNLVATAIPELEVPLLDAPTLKERVAEALNGITLAKDAQSKGLKEAIKSHLQPGQQQWINELAPTELVWPLDKPCKLVYPEQLLDEDDQPTAPELQAKLHDCLQAKTHPAICEGKVAIKLWLTTPDGKRMDHTFNWPAFRTNTYPKLKVSLQKKFPGLLWP